MTINKLISLLSITWIIVLGLLWHVRVSEVPQVAGTVAVSGGALTVDFLDVGQGDATLLTFADSQQMLIDCAVDSRILETLGNNMTFFDTTIEYLVVTHPDQDHYGGCIDVLERYDVGTVVYSGFEKPESVFYYAFVDAIEGSGATLIMLEEPERWQIASSTIDFLYPVHSLAADPDIPGFDKTTGANNSSIVILIDRGDTELLLTGDGESELEEFLLREYGNELDIDILKAGHHGSNSSSIQPFVDVTSPAHVVYSAGRDNRYGHPTPRVQKRFERAGSYQWRTDQLGDIAFVITDTEIEVQGEIYEIDRSNN